MYFLIFFQVYGAHFLNNQENGLISIVLDIRIVDPFLDNFSTLVFVEKYKHHLAKRFWRLHIMAELNKTNLIVNYLPQQFTDKEFHELFSKPGQLTASKIIRDRATGYSYGFGFVDYETEEDAANAISMLNGYKIQHKIIKVSYSRMGDNVKGGQSVYS